MVINLHHQFIFVHIPKTAGLSVKKQLTALPGNDTTCIRKNTKHETLCDLYNDMDRLPHKFQPLGRMLKSFFTFGFVRNPWDRICSLYRFLKKWNVLPELDTVESFRDFLIHAANGQKWIRTMHSMRPQLDFFTFPDKTMKIGFLGHYEFLEEDFNTAMSRLGLSIHLSQINQSDNASSDYRQAYDDEMIDIVASLFAEDIEHFGYEFSHREPRNRISGSFRAQRDQPAMQTNRDM